MVADVDQRGNGVSVTDQDDGVDLLARLSRRAGAIEQLLSGTSLSMIVNGALLLYAWTARVRPALDSYSSRSRCEHLKDADDP